jgi:hypothetical protein
LPIPGSDALSASTSQFELENHSKNEPYASVSLPKTWVQ